MTETESLLSTNCICPLIHVSLKKNTNFFPDRWPYSIENKRRETIVKKTNTKSQALGLRF